MIPRNSAPNESSTNESGSTKKSDLHDLLKGAGVSAPPNCRFRVASEPRIESKNKEKHRKRSAIKNQRCTVTEKSKSGEEITECYRGRRGGNDTLPAKSGT